MFGAQPGAQIFGAQPATQSFGIQPASQGFGTQPATQGFGIQPAAQSFGARPATQGFGIQQATQNSYASAPNAPINHPPQNFYGAIARCSIFGDDRDALMARWNLLQASWGFGKIYYQQNAPPLAVEQTNPM